ncbi:MAG: hybrid sensor histidine kinase/response regulator [Pseudomarimonas sp.]
MLTLTGVAAAALLWLGLLFAVAVFGERRAPLLDRSAGVVYALSLATYCTSWTFYGTVTQGVRNGWWLPPTFLGTIALYVLALPLLQRLVAVAKSVNATSVADFIASRCGKSSGLAALVTFVALVGMVPYIALQLKAVAMSFSTLVASGEQPPAWQDSALYVALLMAMFAMLFGTRRTASDEGNRGLVMAMAFEAVFKLTAMLVVGGFVVFALYGSPAALQAAWETQAQRPTSSQPIAYLTLAALGAMAMLTLPHQFHVGVVECRDARHLRSARWLFPLFLLLISLPVWPLARAGQMELGALGLPPDLFVLGLPLLHQQHALTLLAFLGGLSAATGMVILASLSLSIMLGNHWITPLLLRGKWSAQDWSRPHLLQRRWLADVRWQRRAGIALVLGLGYGYSRVLGGLDALADIGAQSFSALAQLTPAVLLGIWKPQWPARAVGSGLVVGFCIWAYVLIAPLLSDGHGWALHGPLGVAWLAPASLFGMQDLDPLSRAVWVSLAGNIAVLLLVAKFVPSRAPLAAGQPMSADALRAVAGRFLSEDRLQRVFVSDGMVGETPPSSSLEDRVGHALTAVLGAASTRLLLDAARRGSGRQLDEVATLVGEAAQAARFSQTVLEAALENMSQGISVVDGQLCLVAWNKRYAERFGFPSELLQVGQPVADLARFALRNMMGAGVDIDSAHVEAEVQRRLRHMRAGTPHLSERRFADGAIIEIRGNPMPGGGFVATFTDVTDFRRTEDELKGIAETLEQRVIDRTTELAQASAAAQRASRDKTRFLAAVSHDLAQPLNAARLFAHTLTQQLNETHQRALGSQVEGSLTAAENLLGGLLDISRLDAGGLSPSVAPFAVNDLLAPLTAEFRILAEEKELRFRARGCRHWANTDPQLLRRILQNFLANAVRYTQVGGVLLGVRRRGDRLRIEVWDSGPGIEIADQTIIFEEFRRLRQGGQGLGLGLSIAERLAHLLGHKIELRSVPGRGSCFAITVPACAPQKAATQVPRDAIGEPILQRILVVDNDVSVLAAMQGLLSSWGCEVLTAASPPAAFALVATQTPSLLLLDYHLDFDSTGIVLLKELRAKLGDIPAAIITADHSEAIRREVEAAGAWLLHKPLKPLALKSLLARLASH